MDALMQEIWTEVKALNLAAGQELPLIAIIEKFMNDTDAEPDEIAEAFEALVDKGWLEERGDTAYLTQAGFDAA